MLVPTASLIYVVAIIAIFTTKKRIITVMSRKRNGSDTKKEETSAISLGPNGPFSEWRKNLRRKKIKRKNGIRFSRMNHSILRTLHLGAGQYQSEGGRVWNAHLQVDLLRSMPAYRVSGQAKVKDPAKAKIDTPESDFDFLILSLNF
jgi:hypothetical protein